ncbi:MAG: chromosomal replication initiator protein DnaA [Gammaproteobacteria bacterium]|nr:chromosomal replication initiator protein DnaA [Gammaproteobacteria bacterium]
MAEPQSSAWDRETLESALRARVSPVTWQTWFAHLSYQFADERLRVVAPSEFHVRWVREKHAVVLEEAAQAVFGPGVSVSFSVDTSEDLLNVDWEEEEPAAEEKPPAPRQESFLGAKYTFDNFVVGQSNRFAHAAAMAVAERPGMHYNPLFVYAGAGLGKTHLLRAVGHQYHELNPDSVVRYVTSEGFFNEFIDGIRRKRMDEFKARYRTTNVLLLDDVQFFEGKEQILEEFFHTFNSLYESGKQMVFSCDRHPKHLSTLEDRIRSRFEWGLLTDIQPPDVETRLAILRKNADYAPLPVPEEVLHFIAQHVRANIRELEGALTRVTAYAALTDQHISLEIAQDVLQDLTPAGMPRPITADEIIAATAAAYGFAVMDLRSPSRKQPLVRSRQVAMYLCRELTDLSLPKIGALFGGRDHTTVMHAIDRINTLITSDPQIFDKVTALSQQLRRS